MSGSRLFVLLRVCVCVSSEFYDKKKEENHKKK